MAVVALCTECHATSTGGFSSTGGISWASGTEGRLRTGAISGEPAEIVEDVRELGAACIGLIPRSKVPDGFESVVAGA